VFAVRELDERGLGSMLRPSFLRRMGSAWILVSCLMLSVFVTTALVTALLTFYTAALPATVSRELASSKTLSIAITAQTTGSAHKATSLVAAKLRSAFGPVPYQLYKAVWSNDIALAAARGGGNVPALQAASVSGITTHAALTSGSWPAAPQAGQPVPIALPKQVAADLHVGVGSVLKLRYVGTNAPVRLAVTGLFQPRDPAASYWRLDLIAPSGITVGSGFVSYGPAVVSPAAFSPVPGGRLAALQANEVSFVALPAERAFAGADLDSMAARIDAAISLLQNDGVSLVSTTMPQTLVNAAEGLAAAKSLVVISGLQLLLLAGAALALAGRLLASHREEESALLAARGAARRQLVGPSLTEGVLTCAAAAAVGTIVGVRLAALLLSRLVGRGLQQSTPGAEAWLGAAVVLLLCLGVALWPALRPPAIGVVRVRGGRQVAAASVVAAGADVALVALAVLSVHELLSYSAAAGGSGVDPVIVAAPALALAGLALIPLRLLPVAAKGLDKLSARGQRLGAAMASWEISRRPVRQSGPALLVILAVGTSTLALTQYESWRRSVHDQAAFAVGAQVRVGLVNAEPLSGVTQITRLRGVKAAMPVSQQSLATGQLLAISGPQAAATITMRSDLSAQLPVSKLWSHLDQRQGPPPGLAVPGTPARIEITASMAGGPAGQLGPVAATVTVQDAYGLAYQLPAGNMAADGRRHQLIVQLGRPAGPGSAGSGSAGIAYPLRLLGVSLSYNMPPNPAALAAAGNAVITFSSIAASPSLTAPFPAPFAAGRALAGWSARTSAVGLETITDRLGGQSDGSLKPAVVTWSAAGQDARMTLDPGSGPVLHPPARLAQYGVTTLPEELQLTIPPSRLAVPLIATGAFLRANGMSAGASVPISIAGANVGGKVVGTVADFPTVTAGGAVVADQSTLQDAVISAGGAPLPATAWWLTTSDGQPPAGLPAGSSVIDAAALTAALEHDPVSAAPIDAALAVAAAAALLAVVGLCVSVAASARGRRGQRALLSALGVPGSTQAGLFCLEEIMISGPAALIGLALGIGVAHLLIPAITLTATAGLPLPPVLVRIPGSWVALIVVAMPAIPVLAAALATLRLPDPAAELRATEAA
jgi:hypothetical protein